MQFNPIIYKLKQVKFIQDAIKEPSYTQKLFILGDIKNTIPVLFYLKNGSYFKAHGNVEKLKGSDCFITPFFRIEDIYDCIVTLSLLKPTYQTMKLNKEICDVISVKKTSFCLDINIEIIGGIQFLSPHLVQ